MHHALVIACMLAGASAAAPVDEISVEELSASRIVENMLAAYRKARTCRDLGLVEAAHGPGGDTVRTVFSTVFASPDRLRLELGDPARGTDPPVVVVQIRAGARAGAG